MRLAFSDIKKAISRRDGERRLVPYFLPVSASFPRTSARTSSDLAALIALYESFVGQPRAAWPEDRPALLLADYRLARCLDAVLSEWYTWQPRAWTEMDAEAQTLAGLDITSSSQLRLALYDFVSATSSGYVPANARDAALDAFAATVSITRATLDNLLYLDSDAQAVLTRAAEAPTPAQLATRYNQRAFEAVLANAASVEWTVPPTLPAASGEPLGATVKRVCFLARRMGVQYDVAFTDADRTGELTPGDAGAQSLRRVAERPKLYHARETTDAALELPEQAEMRKVAGDIDASLTITLSGPQEVTGASTQYGERLARLCRALLGYRRGADRPGRAALAGPGLSGVARVLLHGRPLTFLLDAKLLSLLTQPDVDAPAWGDAAPAEAAPQFDSSLEQHLYEQFIALERDGAARGWRLEREPDPILIGPTILVPDFALTRGAHRVFLEIAGYWRPEYRERKARKLAAVRGRVALVLAAPESARAEFAGLERDYPLLWYKDAVSAEVLLALLDRTYGDFDARLAQVGQALPALAAEVTRRGLIPPAESMALLRSYSRAELTRALALLRAHTDATGEAAPEWVEGAGLCSPSWLADQCGALRKSVLAAEGLRLPLATLTAALAARVPGVGISDDLAERLSRRAGLHVLRTSIFDAVVSIEEQADADVPPGGGALRGPPAQPRRRARRTHTGTTSYSTQSIFPPERTGPDNPEPDLPTRAP